MNEWVTEVFVEQPLAFPGSDKYGMFSYKYYQTSFSQDENLNELELYG